MQFTLSVSELRFLFDLDASERVRYFLERTSETEEVWTCVQEGYDWGKPASQGASVLQIWPYEQLACEFALLQGDGFKPSATSLDHFVHSILADLAEQNVLVEIMPISKQPGTRVQAAQLHETYLSMLDAGEYYLEG